MCACVSVCVPRMLHCPHSQLYFKSPVSSLTHASVSAPAGQLWRCCRIIYFFSFFPGRLLFCPFYCADPCLLITPVYLNPSSVITLSCSLIDFSLHFFGQYQRRLLCMFSPLLTICQHGRGCRGSRGVIFLKDGVIWPCQRAST